MRYAQYKKFTDAQLNFRLLWEYDATQIDFDTMRELIVQRVIQRGWPQDWYFILNRYGWEEVKEVIRNIARLSEKDMQFVSREFRIPIEELKSHQNQS
jgi:hypothetical protein